MTRTMTAMATAGTVTMTRKTLTGMVTVSSVGKNWKGDEVSKDDDEEEDNEDDKIDEGANDYTKDADGYGIPTDCGAILCDKYEVDDDDNDDNLGP